MQRESGRKQQQNKIPIIRTSWVFFFSQSLVAFPSAGCCTEVQAHLSSSSFLCHRYTWHSIPLDLAHWSHRYIWDLTKALSGTQEMWGWQWGWCQHTPLLLLCPLTGCNSKAVVGFTCHVRGQKGTFYPHDCRAFQRGKNMPSLTNS